MGGHCGTGGLPDLHDGIAPPAPGGASGAVLPGPGFGPMSDTFTIHGRRQGGLQSWSGLGF